MSTIFLQFLYHFLTAPCHTKLTNAISDSFHPNQTNFLWALESVILEVNENYIISGDELIKLKLAYNNSNLELAAYSDC